VAEQLRLLPAWPDYLPGQDARTQPGIPCPLPQRQHADYAEAAERAAKTDIEAGAAMRAWIDRAKWGHGH
jgi:hypothetical protein